MVRVGAMLLLPHDDARVQVRIYHFARHWDGLAIRDRHAPCILKVSGHVSVSCEPIAAEPDSSDDWPLTGTAQWWGYRIYGGITSEQALPDATISLIWLLSPKHYTYLYTLYGLMPWILSDNRRPRSNLPLGKAQGSDHFWWPSRWGSLFSNADLGYVPAAFKPVVKEER